MTAEEESAFWAYLKKNALEVEREKTPIQNRHSRPQTQGDRMQEDIYSLPEGRVVIQWPSELTPESIQDVKDWLKLVKRKISRSPAPKGESQ